MPAYDDVASLYCREGNWHMHYSIPGDNELLLSKETLALAGWNASVASCSRQRRPFANQ